MCPTAPHLHSIAETCDLLGCVSEDWLIKGVRTGVFPARRIVREIRFSDEDIADIISACAAEPRQAAPQLPMPTVRSRRRTQ
jgi:hypothetical protein